LAAVTIIAHDVGGIGGMERQVGELVNGLLADGCEVTVVSRTCELRSHPGLRHLRVPGPARPFPIAYPAFLLLGSLLAWRRRRGVVHTAGAIVLNRADVITVHLCHHTVRDLRRARRATLPYRLNAVVSAWMGRLGERYAYRASRGRRLVSVSAAVARELEPHFPRMRERIVVIPNGVDLERFISDPETRVHKRRDLGLPPDVPVALFVGNEWDGKGLRFAIEALGSSPRWRLIVAGAGDRPRYEEAARELSVVDRVIFLGSIEDTPPLYQAADAFLLPTAYESFSLVTYEAAASGLPLLVSRVGGVEDILSEGVNGWFIERDADVIASRLKALEDPSVRAAMGHAAREASLRFDWQRMVAGYRALYLALDEAATAVPGPPSER
jgi:UDP-glucose:(heptosyl)LPS alpha-1,3-glucosyltransferase